MTDSLSLNPNGAQRRRLLLASGALGALGTLVVTPLHATPEKLNAAIARFTGGAALRNGRVAIDVAKLVDNGNTVPVTVSVEAGPSGQPAQPQAQSQAQVDSQRVVAIGLFTERNPLPEVAIFTFGPMVAKPVVSTRMRLATSQKVTAVAKMADGSCWASSVNVVVTLAACLEGDG